MDMISGLDMLGSDICKAERMTMGIYEKAIIQMKPEDIGKRQLSKLKESRRTMDIRKIPGTQLCMNSIHCDTSNRGACTHPLAVQVWAANQRNGCDYFKGNLVQIDWDNAVAAGAMPSTSGKI